MLQDWVSFGHFSYAVYGDCFSVFVSEAGGELTCTNLAHMPWVSMFTPVLSFSWHSEKSQGWSLCARSRKELVAE